MLRGAASKLKQSAAVSARLEHIDALLEASKAAAQGAQGFGDCWPAALGPLPSAEAAAEPVPAAPLAAQGDFAEEDTEVALVLARASWGVELEAPSAVDFALSSETEAPTEAEVEAEQPSAEVDDALEELSADCEVTEPDVGDDEGASIEDVSERVVAAAISAALESLQQEEEPATEALAAEAETAGEAIMAETSHSSFSSGVLAEQTDATIEAEPQVGAAEPAAPAEQVADTPAEAEVEAEEDVAAIVGQLVSEAIEAALREEETAEEAPSPELDDAQEL